MCPWTVVLRNKNWSSMYVRSFVFDPGSGQSVACRLAACLDPELVVMSILVGATALAVLASVALVYLREAEEVLAEEYARTVAERDAFQEFARLVDQLDGTTATTNPSQPAGGLLSQSRSSGERLGRVREAYSETVMGVAHYEKEYDDTLRESMSAEFCEEVASAVENGTRLSPQLKAGLLQGSHQSRTEREALLQALDRESDALDRAKSEFAAVYDELERVDDRPLTEKPLIELGADWDRLSDLERRCQAVLDERQKRIHAGYPSLPCRSRGVSFHEYLYGSFVVTHPVLADGVELAGDIRTARRRILQAARASR